MSKHSQWDQFAEAAIKAGLEPVRLNGMHWQLKGGAMLVNYYPNAKRGPKIYVAGTKKGRYVSGVDEAIRATRERPKVAKHHRDKRSKDTKMNRHRRELLYAKSNRCYWCGCYLTLESTEQTRDPKASVRFATLDHVIPLSVGGLDNMNNIVLACEPCNSARSDKMPELSQQQQGAADES